MYLRRKLILAFALFAAQAFAATITITPTTTLARETANNTSTASTFAGLTNGDPAGGNVSKLPLRNLIPGFNGTLLAHYMPWWGNTGHINIGYSSHDPAQADKTVLDMISRGYNGVMVTEANSNSWDQQGALTMFAAVQNHPGFLFAVSDNKGAYSGVTDVTAKMLSNMDFDNTHYFQSPQYLRVNGRPVVFVFDNVTGIDWSVIQSQSAGHPMFVFRNKSGFSPSYSDGAFSWIGMPSSTDLTGLGYLDGFYQTAQSYPAKVSSGSAWKGFNDTAASWTQNRIVDQQCGNLWMDSMAHALTTLPAGPAIMKLATWNDYEEGTELETGIDNCASMQAVVSNGTLSFSPTFSSASGSERTIDHYEAYISQDGQNLMKLTDVSAGMHSIDVSSYALAAGTYSLFVKMVGQPGILNRMSPEVSYTVAPPPPAPTPAPTPVPVPTPIPPRPRVPAKVTLNSTTSNFARASQAVLVSATASSPAKVTAMRILVDGRSVSTIPNVTSVNRWVAAGKYRWHTIQVLAFTDGDWVKSSIARVYVSR